MEFGSTGREFSRRAALLGMAGLGAAGVAGCRLAVDEARGAVGGGPRRGGTLVMGVNIDAKPAAVQSQGPISIAWRGLVFEPLTSYDSAGVPQPVLARSWELADGGRTVTMHLRDDVRFHSGRPMTAQDVIFSLRRTTQPAAQSQVKPIALLIDDMSAPDPHTVRLRLKRPAVNLFDLFQYAMIVDSESAAGIASGRAMIGTGPFVWRSWTPGSQLTLVRNPAYRVPGRPYLDRVEQPVFTDPTALVTAVRGGRAHVVFGITPLDARGLSKDERFHVNRGISLAYVFGLNTSTPPFNDPQVRRAVAYAIDRERIVKQVFAGYGDTSSLWWSRKEPGWDAAQAAEYRYDPARAKAMLRQAGVAGTQVTIDVINTLGVMSTAQIVRYDLEAAGLRVATKVYENVDFSSRLVKGALGQAYLNSIGMADMSAATIVSASPMLTPGHNPSHFTTPEYGAAVNAALTASAADRPAAVRRLAAYMQDQAFIHSLGMSNSISVQSQRVRGLRFDVVGSFLLDSAYLV
ncbi:ABC transporter substrate-binding protein [Actinoallomurus sp. NPDC050550]|uniref:ABC transporter substrate-binding protein n=1 Tax=Actinoallomurus sp. NPDC050550 TaxID=3154937 RepID=UPI0033DC403E